MTGQRLKLNFPLFMCVVHVCVLVSWTVTACVHAFGGQRSMSSVFLNCPLLYFLDKNLLLNLRITSWVGSLVSSSGWRQGGGVVYLLLPLQEHASGFAHGCEASEFRASCLCGNYFTN